MILNIFVCVFLLGMAVLWSTYGLFSSFLNLLVVVCSGLIAFAVWEPVAHWMLGMGWQSAWGLGLLVPYLVVLIALRLAAIVAVRKNLGFHPVADQIGGGVFGLLAGILTAGTMVIGAGAMANDKDLLGVQGYTLNTSGRIEKASNGSTLWLGVDRYAGSLFEALSAGAFSPAGGGGTLASTHPDVAKEAETHRLAVDLTASRTAAPAGVEVTAVYEMECTPESAEWLMRRAATYAVMRQVEVDKIPLEASAGVPYTQAQINGYLTDAIAEALKAGDPEALLFDKEYLAQVRKCLRQDKRNPPEVTLQALLGYTADQIPEGASSARKDESAPVPVGKLFVGSAGKKIILVDTAWDKTKSKAYDEGALRISPSQIKLVAAPVGKAVAGTAYFPDAWSTPMAGTNTAFARRELVDLTEGKASGIYGTLAQEGKPDKLGFVFMVPKDATLAEVQLRGLRFPLAKSVIKNASGNKNLAVRSEMARVIGHLLPPVPADGVNDVAERPTATMQGTIVLPAATVEFTNRLPFPLSWASPVLGVDVEERRKDFVLIRGAFDQERGRDLGHTNLRIMNLQVPANCRSIRLQLTLAQCQAMWGRVLDSSERGHCGLVLRAESGPISAAGFIVARAEGASSIRIDPNGSIRVAGKALADLRPIVGTDDKVYAYYFVDELETLVGFGLWDTEAKKAVADRQFDLLEKLPLKKVPVPN